MYEEEEYLENEGYYDDTSTYVPTADMEHNETLDSIWIAEFKKMMADRAMDFPLMTDDNIPLPDSLMSPVFNTGSFLLVGEVSEQYFNVLSNTYVYEVAKDDEPLHRRRDANGDFLRDAKTNKIKAVRLKRPTESVCVVTKTDIQAPLVMKIKTRDIRGSKVVEYKAKESGFRFIDCIENGLGGTPDYYYYIPKKYLYRVNGTALVVAAEHNRGTRKFYAGAKVAFTNGQYASVYIVDYPSKYISGKILAVKPNADYSQELAELYSYWESIGASFPSYYTEAYDKRKGRVINVTFEEYPANKQFYVDVDKSKTLDKQAESEFNYEEQMQEAQ